MKSFATALAALAIALPAFSAPATSVLKKLDGPVQSDSYIIVLKAGIDTQTHLKALTKSVAARSTSSYTQVTHKYADVLHGYAAVLRGPALDHVLASKDVAYIEQNGIVSIKYEEGSDFSMEVEARGDPELVARASSGAGVDVYGIDTGIYTAHTTFGGRARWGATFGGYANQDGNGHGTHTAGTAVGAIYGVATSANIIAVKVLSDSGSGTNADVISGINYAYNAFKTSRRPSVVTMSLGGGINTAVDSAVSNAIAGGLHFAIAAGNSNVDASTTSPARVASANTVGAVDSRNIKASFSNFGSVLDVWALGVNVRSAWIGSTTATNVISGTSMATPFVAGVLAVALSEFGQVSPASLSSSLKLHAQSVVTGASSATTKLKAVRW